MSGGQEARPRDVHEGALLRRLAHLGATRLPGPLLRATPWVVGAAAAALLPAHRRRVRENLRLVRGPRAGLAEARDVVVTFGRYASCVAESLASGGPRGVVAPRARIFGAGRLEALLERPAGFVLVTAHTAGWETLGPLLGRDHAREVTFVMAKEPDAKARAVSDRAREAAGVRVVHAGDDPLAALPLLRALRGGGIVAVQLDGAPASVRAREVPFFGETLRVPEGPLRLAGEMGVPVVSAFAARRGFRDYDVHVSELLHLPKGADAAALDTAAAALAGGFERFARAHPTHWFRFR